MRQSARIDTSNFTYYAFAAMEWTKANISDATKEYLGSLPLTIEKDDMFFTHSSPSNPQAWVYVFPDSEEAVFEAFNSLTYRLNFIGHTHWPSIMIQSEERIILHSDHSIKLNGSNYYLINVGSIGQPRDFDSRSCYVIYDTETQAVSLVRVYYDFRLRSGKSAATISRFSLPNGLKRAGKSFHHRGDNHDTRSRLTRFSGHKGYPAREELQHFPLGKLLLALDSSAWTSSGRTIELYEKDNPNSRDLGKDEQDLSVAGA